MSEAPAPLTKVPSVVVIGDLVDGWPPRDAPEPSLEEAEAGWRGCGAETRFGPTEEPASARERLAVVGGYLERLPLACVKTGLADYAEIWHHWRAASPPFFRREGPLLARRAFRVRQEVAPFASNDMLGFIRAFGAPHILCVLGLGVDPAILQACARSVRIYNSIDAPALRVPPDVGGLFDLVLTGSPEQSDDVRARHPGMPCAVMPIGPEFADPDTFRPLGTAKDCDIVYVAAAQRYKRHDILFDALERLPRTVRALCVFGYGELGQALREDAAARGLNVEFVGPPGVSFAEVNRLMNRARIGVVCGVDDGAPAILTEYMLAGLPVLANAQLRCGLQFIRPDTGLAVPAEAFAQGIAEMLGRPETFSPRERVLAEWTWPHTAKRLARLIAST